MVEAASVLTLADIHFDDAAALLHRFGLRCSASPTAHRFPAATGANRGRDHRQRTVYARSDTPVHSLLHEACHLIVLPPERRAPCTPTPPIRSRGRRGLLLQGLLADALPGVGSDRVLADMDAWGYTFRLGSARAWFEHDADDAWAWLQDADWSTQRAPCSSRLSLAKRVAGSAAPGLSGRGSASGRMLAAPASA
jgi:hypothetical protein